MQPDNKRFQDQNFILSDFDNEVLVGCPACGLKAMATITDDKKFARLLCSNCGFNKTHSTQTMLGKSICQISQPAHAFFGATLWLQAPFRDDVFSAYNYAHLAYLEAYISSKMREHKDRAHFTLLEKLPKFYHEGKNRSALLKIIEKLKKK
jgi:predicted RNA-binding Zn-ribbon protein involved in translation (DUF1610 family)